ncbi:MAG: M14 family metallopeptidase, partial [Pseudomonadota bacterium]
NNARYFDDIGEPYFTREVYDLFYPGYGDTWNTHQGAIGSTYEQGSPRGLLYKRSDGSDLTFGMAVRNQFITSFATAEAVAENAATFLSTYAAYRRDNANGAAGRATYVIDLATRRWNAEQMARKLAGQGIQVFRSDGPSSACGKQYNRGYLAVPQAQPAARLVRSLLDKDTPLPRDFINAQERRRDADLPHELYDVTAWSVGLMSGVDVSVCGSAVSGTPVAADAPIASVAEGSGAFGIAVPWTDSGQARLVTLAIREGLIGRATDEAFVMQGRTFERGTVVFAARANSPEKMARLAELAREVGGHTVALESSWTDDGPNLGSSAFARINLPRVAMAWDDGVSQLSAGATRFVLEQRFGLPVVPIRANRFGRADLSEYDVVIIPNGAPAGAMGPSGLSNIARFVRAGGVLVTIENAMRAFTRGDNALLSLKREAALGSEPGGREDTSGGPTEATEISSEAEYRAAIEDENALPDTLPGALLNTVADTESFLSAGYDEGAIVLASGSQIFAPLDRSQGSNVLRFAGAENLVASGYVWEENQRQMAFKPYMVAQPSGRGLTIGFAHDPSTRGYLDGLDLLLANAVLIAPSRIR